jgi:hypothetical protein
MLFGFLVQVHQVASSLFARDEVSSRPAMTRTVGEFCGADKMKGKAIVVLPDRMRPAGKSSESYKHD